MARPKEATIAVTYKCNSRCVMCNIWRLNEPESMPPSEYRKLPSSLTTVNVTGGEPFLRDDLVEVVREIHNAAPRCRIVISSNGMLTHRIMEMMSEIRKFHPGIGIGISVDGTKDIHNSVRGVKGGFEKAIETVKQLKAAHFKDIRIGMTIVEENSGQVLEVYKLSKELGVQFTTTVAHNSTIYFRKDDNNPKRTSAKLASDLGQISDDHLRSLAPKNWFRAYHLAGVADSSMRKQSKNCSAGARFVFIDPKGCVYPCIVLDKMMGNIKENPDLESLLSSQGTKVAMENVRRCKEDCWMVCNIRSLILSHPGRSVSWIIRNKPRAHVVGRAKRA